MELLIQQTNVKAYNLKTDPLININGMLEMAKQKSIQ